MATIKLRQFVDLAPELESFLQLKFKAAAAFQIFEAVEELQSKIDTYQKARQGLFGRLGEKFGDNGMKIKDEHMQEYEAEINPLLDTDVEVKLPIIQRKQLRDSLVDEASLSPMLLIRLKELVFDEK